MRKKWAGLLAVLALTITPSYVWAQTSTTTSTTIGTTSTTVAPTTTTTICYQLGVTGSFGDPVICGPGPLPPGARPAVPLVVQPHGDLAATPLVVEPHGDLAATPLVVQPHGDRAATPEEQSAVERRATPAQPTQPRQLALTG